MSPRIEFKKLRLGWRQSDDSDVLLRPCLAAISSRSPGCSCSEWAERCQGGRGLGMSAECRTQGSARIWDVKDTREHTPSHLAKAQDTLGFLTGGKDQWVRGGQMRTLIV